MSMLEIWTKDDVNHLNEQDYEEWFDVYNHGLLEDRGFDVCRLTKEEKNYQHDRIKQDYIRYLRELKDDTSFLFYIVKRESKIVSVSRVVKKGHHYYLEGLETHRKHRKQGHGKDVVEKVLRELKKRDVETLYSVIRSHNLASQLFHQKIGFELQENLDYNNLYRIQI